MLDAYTALRAHARCKARLAALVGREDLDHAELASKSECELVRFIQDCEARFGEAPEVRMLKTAHATVHSVALGLAQKRAAGQKIDAAFEFGSHSNFGSASSLLVSAIWRMERKLLSMA